MYPRTDLETLRIQETRRPLEIMLFFNRLLARRRRLVVRAWEYGMCGL
jgi:hypothetical protein